MITLLYISTIKNKMYIYIYIYLRHKRNELSSNKTLEETEIDIVHYL